MTPFWMACSKGRRRLRPPSMAITISERTEGVPVRQLARSNGAVSGSVKLPMAAAQWLAAHRVGAGILRFDVASVRPDGRGWVVDVIEAAF